MSSNQQFCLRWNNHQSTLISVFDALLESGTLVDCTLAAEGQYLKAHKVVLSACSPYLGMLLSQHYEKHPILILKDIKFQELKSMLDYMYRGEVNISQEQLGTFLKAAESLQIKGLTDSGGGIDTKEDMPIIPLKRHGDNRKSIPLASALRRSPPHTVNHRWSNDVSDTFSRSSGSVREGSMSPTPRKRKRSQKPNGEDPVYMNNQTDEVSENVKTSLNDSESAISANSPVPLTNSNNNNSSSNNSNNSNPNSNNNNNNNVSPNNNNNNNNNLNNNNNNNNKILEKKSLESVVTELKLQNNNDIIGSDKKIVSDSASDGKDSGVDGMKPPKHELSDEVNYEDSVEDMGLEEEEEELDEPDASQAGPSNTHAPGAGWQLAEYHQDSLSSSQQDSQDALYPATRYLITSTDMDGAESMDYFTMGVRTPRTLLAALSTPPLLEKSEAESLQKNIECNKCGRMYKLKSSLLNHQRWECGKDPQFKCTLCDYKAKQKAHLLTHIKYRHKHD
ncbi:uncharacterized protein [Bemisia tabaci]|uniref:uncharacterized protein isoform X3 n=1 Tax=Bemisia tabaci TaxID=7038 RepID=UPI0008F9D631|nr:PREDICTED: longitudinals lacking protein, isoforms A/B/D/L-like isoform X3 [Bemisia tabaci]